MYRVSAIVLRRNDFSHTSSIITLFSDEFGKFDCFFSFSKTAPKLDIGSYLTATIQTKKWKNTLVSIHTHQLIETQKWDYPMYELFLWFFSTMYKLLPEWNQYPVFFSDISLLFLYQYAWSEKEVLFFVVLRFLVTFGIFGDDFPLSSREIQMSHFSWLQSQLSKCTTAEIKTFATWCCDHFHKSV